MNWHGLRRSAYTAQAVNEINCEAIYELAWLKKECIYGASRQ